MICLSGRLGMISGKPADFQGDLIDESRWVVQYVPIQIGLGWKESAGPVVSHAPFDRSHQPH